MVTITDDTTDHTSGLATTTQALGGVTTGVTVTGQDNDGTTKNAIRWLNTDILDASSTGTANYKNLTIDFSTVVFTGPGVYRYKITETASAYTTSGVTDGSINAVRYLDVYVMRSSSFNAEHDGTSGHEFVADDWKIYGYVCIAEESVATNAGGTTAVTTSTTKTNGFVDTDSSTSTSTADEYRTYNLTIGKTLSGDTTMNSHKFPFDATWTAGDATGSFRFAVEVANATVATTSQTATNTVNGTAVNAGDLLYTYDTTNTAEYALTSADKDGSPSIATGGTVKYIGIPNGTMVTVTETNDVAGTTYSTRVYADTYTTTYTAPTTQVGFTGGTAEKGNEKSITNALATTDQGDTATYAQGTAPTAGNNQAILFTNTLALISPTGVMMRVAPYALMLGAGILLLVLARRHRKATAAEE